MKFRYALAGLVAAALLLGGCGGEEEPASSAADKTAASATAEKAEAPPPPRCPAPSGQVRVTLDGRMGAENAGVLMAKERGFFRDEGLHVWVGTPGNPEYPVSYVGTGADDVGLAQEPQIVIGNEVEEGRVIALGSVIPEPTAAMIWLKDSGIEGIADLKGKTIATTGAAYQTALLEQALAHAGLKRDDVEVLAAGYELIPTLLAGEVDAIFGGTSNIEGAALEARGAEPVITPVRQLGIPAYDELMVIARAECVAEHPAMYRDFMAALARGTAAAVKDPRGTVRLIEESIESDPETDRKQTAAQVKATLPLLSRNAHVDLDRAGEFATWMKAKGMIEAEPPVGKTFTNLYLGKNAVADVFKQAGPLECPTRSDTISVTLDAEPSGANAGVEMALKRDYFADAGLEVSVGGPKNPARAVRYVSAGIDDVGVASQPQVVLSSEEGGPPLVAFGSVLHKPNAAMIWLPDSGIRDLADLKGKTVGIPGASFQEVFLAQVLKRAGLGLEDVTVKRTNFHSVDALLEGRVDAVFGGTWNVEGAELKARGARPVVRRAGNLGLPPYEGLVLIAPAKCVAARPGLMRDFLAAVARGTKAAEKDPVEAANFAAQSFRLDPRFRMPYLRAQFAASRPLLSTDFRMDLALARRLGAWMRAKGLIEREPPAGMFTNRLLGQP